MELDEEAYARAIAQHGQEFAVPRQGWFDGFVNGLNRLPRPLLALGTMALFIYAMVEPIGFGIRMEGLQRVPEPLWWLLGAIVGFYFGAREAHHFRHRVWPAPVTEETTIVPAPSQRQSPFPRTISPTTRPCATGWRPCANRPQGPHAKLSDRDQGGLFPLGRIPMLSGNKGCPQMIAELGHFALILAFMVAIYQMTVPMIGAAKGWHGWMDSARPAAMAQLLLMVISFGALTIAFVTSDFSVLLVYENSHTLKPMLYKISGVWGNHEGSMLLWVLILALFGAAAALFGGNLPPSLRARVLGVQASVSVAFYAFIIFTSNPFWRMGNPPFDGRDLNPLLQDPGLAFHPPFLYLGYVGLSMAFSFAVAALIEGRVDAAWARWVRPWTLAAWVFLTIGIALGSWWAYYELGWGGFWFWDPVENASFMPWLLAAALLHSAIVVEKREALKSWTILLAIMAFGFSLIGTFIVRSGVITSVHSFANDPERGVFILAILAVFIGGALTLFAARASEMTAKGVFAPLSREGALVLNNVLLAVSALSCSSARSGRWWPRWSGGGCFPWARPSSTSLYPVHDRAGDRPAHRVADAVETCDAGPQPAPAARAADPFGGDHDAGLCGVDRPFGACRDRGGAGILADLRRAGRSVAADRQFRRVAPVAPAACRLGQGGRAFRAGRHLRGRVPDPGLAGRGCARGADRPAFRGRQL